MNATAVSVSKCYCRHRFKNVTAIAAEGILRWPLDCYRNVTAATVSRILPPSVLQERYTSHCFKQVTVVTASRVLPQSPLQECYRSHRFKNVTAVTVSRRAPLSPFQECGRRCHFYTCLLLRFVQVSTGIIFRIHGAHSSRLPRKTRPFEGHTPVTRRLPPFSKSVLFPAPAT